MDEAVYVVFGNVDRDNGMFVSKRDLGDDDGQDQRDGGFRLDPLVFVQYMYTISISIYSAYVYECVYRIKLTHSQRSMTFD